MRWINCWALVGLLMAIPGCSGGDTAQPAGKASVAAATAKEPAAQDPIAQAAFAFLEAVVAGDTPRATSMLTPAAIAQFEQSKQGFASPEIGAPEFRVGEVRQVSDDKAAVQCLLSDQDGEAEMCCLMRRVANGWRVSGVAYELDPNRPPVILNFEQPDAGDAGELPQFVEGPQNTGAAPRTASDPALPPLR